MKIQFKTISIGLLVLSYLGVMAICLLLILVFDLQALVLLSLILPVVLYFIFSGEVALRTFGDKLLVTWIKRPLFTTLEDSEIQLNEVIRWKHQRSSRGPDSFTIILKNGDKFRFRPDMFSLRDWQSELWGEFENTMREFHSNTSKEELYDKIIHSGYVAKLDYRIKIITYLNCFLIAFGLLSLILMIPYPKYETALSIFFLVVFILLSGITIYNHHLKTERKETLRRW